MQSLATEGGGGEITTTDFAAWAEPINAAHHAAEQGVVDSMKNAIEAGRLLVAVKDKLKHGQFSYFLDQNFAGAVRTAQWYMQLFRTQGQLSGKSRNAVALLSQRQAMKAIASTNRKVAKLPEPIRDKAAHAVLAGSAATIEAAVVRIEDRAESRRRADVVREANNLDLQTRENAIKRGEIADPAEVSSLLVTAPELSPQREEIARLKAEHAKLEEEYNNLADRLGDLANTIYEKENALRRHVEVQVMEVAKERAEIGGVR